jgi:hypothetical protein
VRKIEQCELADFTQPIVASRIVDIPELAQTPTLQLYTTESGKHDACADAYRSECWIDNEAEWQIDCAQNELEQRQLQQRAIATRKVSHAICDQLIDAPVRLCL